MSRLVIVKVDKVMPFAYADGNYSSKMLIDESNTGSIGIHLNHGVLKKACEISEHVHPHPYDEVYYVLSGQAVLEIDGKSTTIGKNMVVFIPARAQHKLMNTSQTEDFVFLTIWPGTPEPGINTVYDMRKKAWGETYREIGDK